MGIKQSSSLTLAMYVGAKCLSDDIFVSEVKANNDFCTQEI